MSSAYGRWWGWLGTLILATTGILPAESVLCSEADGVRLELATAGRCLERWTHAEGDAPTRLVATTPDARAARPPSCSDLDLPEGWSSPGATAAFVPPRGTPFPPRRGRRSPLARTDPHPAKTRIHLQLRLLLN